MRIFSYNAAMLMTDEHLLSEIEAFLNRTGMKPTRFGIEVLGDGGLVKGLREGRSLTLRSAEQVVSFMAEYRPDTPKAA